jgi:hypothetical protein
MGSENAHEHITHRMVLVFEDFLQWYHKDGDEFLSHIVTSDETWVSIVNVETKEQSKQWIHTHSSNKLKKLKQRLPAYQRADGNWFLRQERSADGAIRAARDLDIKSVLWNTKKKK